MNTIVSAKVWHPCGAECLIQFNGQMTPFDGMVGFRQHLASQGWLLENPNKERPVAEEKVEAIDGVARLQKVNGNGSVSDIIAFYSVNQSLKKAVAKIYLDTPAQRAAFAELSGVDPESIAVFDGSTAPERNQLTVRKMVGVRPFKITLSPNPRYDDAKAKKAAADKAAGVANVKPYTIPMRVITKYEREDGVVIAMPASSPPQQQSQGGYTQPRQAPSGGGPDRRAETNQPSGPVNGVITDPDFRKLLTVKGFTFQTAMQRIDRLKKTDLARSARSAADIPADILGGFVNWLRTQQDIPQRPTESYGNAPQEDRGRIPF